MSCGAGHDHRLEANAVPAARGDGTARRPCHVKVRASSLARVAETRTTTCRQLRPWTDRAARENRLSLRRRLPEAAATVLGSGTMASRYAPIGDYGVIGDLYTVALVGMDGSIDFLCLPHFDSPSVFAALVDAERGGRFQISPLLEGAARKQLYLPDTNVLLTRFLDAHGVAELSDFMPVEDAGLAHNLVRRAKTVRGEVRFQMRCEPRFDYARASHTAERRSDTEVPFFGRSGDGER